MKRVNWEESVAKWERQEELLLSGVVISPYAMEGVVHPCGYCEEYLGERGCVDCPLWHRGLCHRSGEHDSVPFWLFVSHTNAIHKGRIANTYGNRHIALGYVREILQGMYVDMHMLED